MTVEEAMENFRHFSHALGGDPYGFRTVTGAKAAYVRGEIEVDELERRIGILLTGCEVPNFLALPGERIINSKVGRRSEVQS